MRVSFIPLDAPRHPSLVVSEFPVILTRSSRADLPPQAYTISPCHCEIEQVGGVLRVRDLGSRHGTFVNGSRINSAYLWPGDKLTIGLSSFRVEYELCRGSRGANGDDSGHVALPLGDGLDHASIAGLV
jgi:pSer/pThr/pTyr-binding forkhead associated (FHA) protein